MLIRDLTLINRNFEDISVDLFITKIINYPWNIKVSNVIYLSFRFGELVTSAREMPAFTAIMAPFPVAASLRISEYLLYFCFL